MWSDFFNIDHYVLSLYSLGPLFAGIFILLLGLEVAFRERASLASLAFLFFSISIFIWLTSYAAMTGTDVEGVALKWAYIKHFGVALAPSAILILTLTVIQKFRRYRIYALASLVLSCFFYIAVPTTHLFVQGVYHYSWGYYPKYAIYNLGFIFYFVLMMLTSIVLYAVEYRKAEVETQKKRLRTFLIAFSIGSFASVDYLAAFGIPVYPFGYIPVLMFTVLMARTVLRYRLLDITPSFAADQIIATMSDALIVFDYEGMIRFTNDAAKKLFQKELTGKSITQSPQSALFSSVDLERVHAGKILEGAEVTYRNAEGKDRVLSVSASSIRDSKNKIAGTSMIIRDMTEQKKAREHLRMSEEHNRLIIETAYDAFVGMDSKGIVTDWNKQAETIFGWKKEEALGRTVAETVIPERYRQTHREGLKRFMATGEGPVLNKRIEITALHKNGHEFPCEITIWPIQLGEQVQFNAFVHDISEQKRSQEALFQKTVELAKTTTQKEQSELFAFAASHDLQEPLAKILAFSDLLKLQLADRLDEKSKDYVSRMQSAAGRMSQLLDALLRFSRVTTKNESVEEFDLNQVIKEVVSDLELKIEASKSSIEFQALPAIRADRQQMREVFQNLISNSVKFRRKDVPHRIKIKSKPSGTGYVEVSVEDNGIGFDQKYAERLFRPFERLHGRHEFEGSGMGLAICQRILANHGGSISAEGKPNKGAVFILKLPVKPTR